MNRLSGKVAIVTGAARGLGKADAILMAREGARVVITDRSLERSREVAATVGGALGICLDVRKESDWQRVVTETMSHYGWLDVLVNNADHPRGRSNDFGPRGMAAHVRGERRGSVDSLRVHRYHLRDFKSSTVL